ncbi:1-phosphofructokinase family hexose kinase [Qipengyuania sp. CAU 1752]
MNPTLDAAYEVDRVIPSRKMRASAERYDPGGGGINVARVFVRLGGNARCYYLSGGATGVALDGLLDLHQLVRSPTRIAGQTRVAAAVHERSSGQEYRFIPGGPEVSEAEWRACLKSLEAAKHDFLVASGSLPRGVPEDFYARVAAMAKAQGMRFVLDTSGPALAAGLEGGDIFLAKPSIGEFRALVGEDVTGEKAIADAAMAVVERGHAEYLVVTMAAEGALLASHSGPLRLPALAVDACSAVGAGDSFLAAMVHALAMGRKPEEAFRFGLAAGAAAVLTPGTDLCRPEDVKRLFEQ